MGEVKIVNAPAPEVDKNLRVLIVDDQVDIRRMLRLMLTELGISQVFEAADGKQAMQFTDTSIDMIDVLICDWNMPEMSGLDLLKHLRVAYPDIPFLMVTGRADIESVTAAKAAGVTGYIIKPFSLDELTAKLTKVMQRK